jgi:NAD(P)-dependent dehydrogenase (short-subunit alcohol dehydrogenase family)
MNRLTGKYALITGASQGLRLQIAIAYTQKVP